MADLSFKVLDWMVSGDTGISSETMAAHLTGRRRTWPSCPPADPADFGRCARLLEAVPELRERLPKMAELGPVWAALIARWDEIETTMREEVGIRGEKGKSARRTYTLMRSIIVRAQSAAQPST